MLLLGFLHLGAVLSLRSTLFLVVLNLYVPASEQQPKRRRSSAIAAQIQPLCCLNFNAVSHEFCFRYPFVELCI